jgi:hypothetical protein
VNIIKDINSTEDDILYKSSWTDAEYYYFSKVAGNDQFDLEIVASRGKLEVILDEEHKVFETSSLSKWPFENFFKAGNYLNSKDKTAFSEVKYFELKVTH